MFGLDKNGRIPFNIVRDADSSNLIIESGDEQFKVHRLVVLSGSPVIAAALKTRKFTEAVTGTFKITDFDPDTVVRMLDYMYSGDYDDDQGPKAVESKNEDDAGSKDAKPSDMLLKHVKVNAIADCYEVVGLRELANEKISKILQDHWCVDVFPSFLQSTFDSTGDCKIHNIAILTAASHINELVGREDYRKLELPASFHAGVLTEVTKESEERRVALRETKRLIQLADLDVGKEEFVNAYSDDSCCKWNLITFCNVENESEKAWVQCCECYREFDLEKKD
ncbi:hypothetical protein KEM55_002515 [Ascosphaera atra]|nr:hypothetical protein KEM55_002515 [Ascosphaera atra]